jgi:hypothetical protein
MSNKSPLWALSLVILLTGCYHAKITTGLPASNDKIDIPWAHGFLFGLVPPSVVDASTKCKSGVSMVETKMSFLNSLASGLTYGVYSPLHITVTCASTQGASLTQGANIVPIAASSTIKEIHEAVTSAVAISKALDKPVYIVQEK